MTKQEVLVQHFSGGTEEDLKGLQDSWPQASYLTWDLNMNAIYSTKIFGFACCLQLIMAGTRTVFCMYHIHLSSVCTVISHFLLYNV
jgi:hypothetical protein